MPQPDLNSQTTRKPLAPQRPPRPSPIIISPKRRDQSNLRTESPVARSDHCPLIPRRPPQTSAKPTPLGHTTPILNHDCVRRNAIGPPSSPRLASDRQRPDRTTGWSSDQSLLATPTPPFSATKLPIPGSPPPTAKTIAVVPTDLCLVENSYRHNTHHCCQPQTQPSPTEHSRVPSNLRELFHQSTTVTP
jgi:hypothetical protein